MCVPGCQETVRHALTRRGFFKGATAGIAAAAVASTASEAAPRKFNSVVDEEFAKNDFTRHGFALEKTWDGLRNSADDHSMKVFDPAIRGKTDRFKDMMAWQKEGGGKGPPG